MEIYYYVIIIMGCAMDGPICGLGMGRNYSQPIIRTGNTIIQRF